MALGIKGLNEQNEYRRYYPGGEVTAHIIGFTGDKRRGPGRHRARAAGVARRHARKPPRDHQPPRRHRRGRRSDPCAAGRPRPRAVDRLAAAVPRVSRAEGGGRAQQGEGRRPRRPRRAERRDPRARELADVQPEPPRQGRARADAQSRAHRHVRARLDDEAVHDRRGARSRQGASRHGDPDGGGHADDRPATRSTTRIAQGR